MARIKTGGRQKGSKNKRTQAREEAQTSVAQYIAAAFRDVGDAHTLLKAVYSDPDVDLHSRMDAAKAAIPYELPRLSATEHSGKIGVTVTITGDDAGLL